MKTLVIIGILMVGMSINAFSMGHPHNMFAARKQMRAKVSTSASRLKPSVCLNWQQTVQLTKTALSERLVVALSQIRPLPTH